MGGKTSTIVWNASKHTGFKDFVRGVVFIFIFVFLNLLKKENLKLFEFYFFWEKRCHTLHHQVFVYYFHDLINIKK